jgi:hypothetical protein
LERDLQMKNDMIVALNTGMQTLNEYHEAQRRAIEGRLDDIANLAGINGSRLRRRRLSEREEDFDDDDDSPIYTDSFLEDDESGEALDENEDNEEIDQFNRANMNLSPIESELTPSYSDDEDQMFELSSDDILLRGFGS